MGIEVTQGFVEQMDRGVAGEEPAQGDSLPLSAGKLGRFSFEQIAQSQPLGNRFNHGSGLGGGVSPGL